MHLSHAHGVPMLSIARCRSLLAPATRLTDERLGRVRDDLYALAHLAIDVLEKVGPSAAASIPHPQRLDEVAKFLTIDELEDVEERAAIMEFDGGVKRDDAERLAVAAVNEGLTGDD